MNKQLTQQKHLEIMINAYCFQIKNLKNLKLNIINKD
jgi:hypothetical protein